MNIQIFGKSKCFDTKKAERWFKERRIKYQYIDLLKYGMSRGELQSVISSVGLGALIADSEQGLIRYLAHDSDKLDKLYEEPSCIQTPVVRNGKKVTVGYRPDVWETWD